MTNIKPISTQKSSLNRQKSLDLKGFPQNTLLEEIRCGYGRCSYSGCYCQNYEGPPSSTTCQNSGCGHSYTDHWNS